MTKRTRSSVLHLALLLAGWTGVASAEDLPSLPTGSRVRVTSTQFDRTVEATVVDSDEKTLTLVINNTIYPVVVSRASIRKIEVVSIADVVPSETSGVQLNKPLRLKTTSGEAVSGTLLGISNESIALRVGEERVEFARASVTKVEVMKGRTARIPDWTAGGAAVGGFAGALYEVWQSISFPRHDYRLAAPATGAVVGGLAGLAIAYHRKRDPHWEEVNPEELDIPKPKVSLGVMPVRGGGAGLIVSLAF